MYNIQKCILYKKCMYIIQKCILYKNLTYTKMYIIQKKITHRDIHKRNTPAVKCALNMFCVTVRSCVIILKVCCALFLYIIILFKNTANLQHGFSRGIA